MLPAALAVPPGAEKNAGRVWHLRPGCFPDQKGPCGVLKSPTVAHS